MLSDGVLSDTVGETGGAGSAPDVESEQAEAIAKGSRAIAAAARARATGPPIMPTFSIRTSPEAQG